MNKKPPTVPASGGSSLVWLIGVAALCAGCPAAPTRGPDGSQASVAEPRQDVDPVYDRGLKNGWQESGSAPREGGMGVPTKLSLGTTGDWILSRVGASNEYVALVFRVKEPIGEGEFLQVALASSAGGAFRPVKLKPDHRTQQTDGWTQAVIPMSELNPKRSPFDRLVFSSFRPVGETWVLLDQISLAKPSPGSTYAQPSDGPPLPAIAAPAPTDPSVVRVRVDCKAPAAPINPHIYGIATGDDAWTKLGATIRRWGGNPTTRYNWEGHFWNTAQDWFFENHDAPQYRVFLGETLAHQASAAVTVPIIGWVAKDGTSYSFPVASYGPQSKTDPWRPDAGNGVNLAGSPIAPGPPTQTSVAAPPEWVARWVSTIASNDAKTGQHSVSEYILDNEPMLWSTTHRDLHPEPLGYDELLDRTVRYASAIRAAQPDAVIAGPAEWGWSGYFFSAKDLDGHFGLHADRLAHRDAPLVAWYLAKLREYEGRTGTRLLDVFDLHYYPQENNVYGGGAGGTDRATQLLRLRSTRSLWDPSYVDESWIREPIRLLPRMRDWVDKNYPGRGLSIGEWNFGGEKDITGALATAEALGRFAQFGVTSAFYWTSPPAGSSSSFGFLAYRNFDGIGGRFLDLYVPTTPHDGVSVFASRDVEGKHLVVVTINMAPDDAVDAEVDLASCGQIASQRAYTYAGAGGFKQVARDGSAATVVRSALPPWSITVFDVQLRNAGGAK